MIMMNPRGMAPSQAAPAIHPGMPMQNPQAQRAEIMTGLARQHMLANALRQPGGLPGAPMTAPRRPALPGIR
jgi:hypothetical protein